MGNSKIVYYGETLIDLTGDTVEAAKLLKGVTAHDKKGEKVTGTLADVAQATPTITVDAAGKITASATQAAGVVAAGTKSATKQLTVQAAKTVTPGTSAQTAVASQRFTTGDVKVAAVNGIIRVTFPTGSTCTCKNGSTTFTSNASDGVAVFIVPNTGTWTLTATDGTKTATKTVSITATSRSANVTLTYGFYIFKSGSGLTSGYSIEATSNNIISVPTVSSDTISWSGSSSSGGISMYIKPAVVLNDYTKLCVDFECSYNWGGDYGTGFGVGTDAASASMITNTNWTAKVTSTAQGAIARNTVQCDISTLTDSEYIKVVGSYSAGKIYNIWLE